MSDAKDLQRCDAEGHLQRCGPRGVWFPWLYTKLLQRCGYYCPCEPTELQHCPSPGAPKFIEAHLSEFELCDGVWTNAEIDGLYCLELVETPQWIWELFGIGSVPDYIYLARIALWQNDAEDKGDVWIFVPVFEGPEWKPKIIWREENDVWHWIWEPDPEGWSNNATCHTIDVTFPHNQWAGCNHHPGVGTNAGSLRLVVCELTEQPCELCVGMPPLTLRAVVSGVSICPCFNTLHLRDVVLTWNKSINGVHLLSQVGNDPCLFIARNAWSIHFDSFVGPWHPCGGGAPRESGDFGGDIRAWYYGGEVGKTHMHVDAYPVFRAADGPPIQGQLCRGPFPALTSMFETCAYASGGWPAIGGGVTLEVA